MPGLINESPGGGMTNEKQPTSQSPSTREPVGDTSEVGGDNFHKYPIKALAKDSSDGGQIKGSTIEERIVQATELQTPRENADGVPYLRGTREILAPQTVEAAYSNLALPKRVVDCAIMRSVISEGDYRRYRSVFPDGTLTPEQFSLRYQEYRDKEVGLVYVMNKYGAIVENPAERVVGSRSQSIDFLDERAEVDEAQDEIGLRFVGTCHSHPSRMGEREPSLLEQELPVRMKLATAAVLPFRPFLEKMRDRLIRIGIAMPSTHDLTLAISDVDNRLTTIVSSNKMYVGVQTSPPIEQRSVRNNRQRVRSFPGWASKKEFSSMAHQLMNLVNLGISHIGSYITDTEIEQAMLEPILKNARRLGVALYAVDLPKGPTPESGLVAKKLN